MQVQASQRAQSATSSRQWAGMQERHRCIDELACLIMDMPKQAASVLCWRRLVRHMDKVVSGGIRSNARGRVTQPALHSSEYTT